MNPTGVSGTIPRFLPEEPFPPYTFVPGRAPHPESDPTGHSFGRERTPAVGLDQTSWMTSKPYLFGLDLFNAGFYWESHVEFESLWIAVGRKGVVADFLKGLIDLAASGVKHLEGRLDGAKNHAHRAGDLWQRVPVAGEGKEGTFLGFYMRDLIALAESIERNGWPKSPPILMPTFPT